jgi:hypothetical protein
MPRVIVTDLGRKVWWNPPDIEERLAGLAGG